MAHVGQVLEGPGGLRLTIAALDDDALVMEARYPGDAVLPPPHLHPEQEERFTVLEGRIRTIVAGEERTYAAGEVLVVAPGTTHQMAGDGPAVTRWEVRPPLRTAELFERLYALLADPAPDPAAGAALLEEFSRELRLA
jgi:hypothetical protein